MRHELQDLLDERGAEFNFNGITWCLYGVNKFGIAWETEDQEADSLESATAVAIEFLKSEGYDALPVVKEDFLGEEDVVEAMIFGIADALFARR